MTYQQQQTSSGACVYRVDDDRNVSVLLVRPSMSRDAWGIPKGHVERKEKYVETAKREVFEETGILIDVEDALTTVYTTFNRTQKRVVSYLAQQVCETVPHPQDHENCDVMWFPIDELPNLHIYQRPLLEEAKRLLDVKVNGVVPASIMEGFEIVYSFANMIDDWLEIKMQLVRMIAPIDRKLFSRRHELSKLQQTNTLERVLGGMWSERTGRPVVWPKQHTE